jgi:ATP-dependent DNA ligase
VYLPCEPTTEAGVRARYNGPPVLASYMRWPPRRCASRSTATVGCTRRRWTANASSYKDGGRVRLVSRNGRDHTRRFAGIAAAVAALSARSLVLDGEVAIYDTELRSRFDWLREPDANAVATPSLLMAFDLLHQDGRELTGRPLRDRRARLEKAVAGSDLVLPVRRLARNGFEAWAEVIAHDFEGLVAKDEASQYEAGPTRRWLKVKQRGWTDAEDRWQRRISVRAER